MTPSWRRYLALGSALLAVPSAGLFAQSSDDLPSAPSAARAPAPKPAPPPSQPQAAPSDDSKAASPAPAAPTDQSATNNSATDTANTPGIIDEEGTKIISRVNEVSVVFTVTDKYNHYIKDLTQRDFRFLDDTVRPRYDKAFVIGFDVQPEVTQDFTDNLELLDNGVRALRPGGGTAMYDALYYACRDKLQKSPQSSAVRRAIILVSDGEDNSSHVTREEAIDMALRANTIVYTISTNLTGSGNGDKVLERIADATGGRAFVPFQLTDVANAFAQIQDDLRSQYELAYRPANFAHDGRYRAIAITAVRKGFKVRSRSGYYAPTE